MGSGPSGSTVVIAALVYAVACALVLGLLGLIGGVVVSAVHHYRHVSRGRPIVTGLVAGLIAGGAIGLVYVVICYFTYAF